MTREDKYKISEEYKSALEQLANLSAKAKDKVADRAEDFEIQALKDIEKLAAGWNTTLDINTTQTVADLNNSRSDNRAMIRVDVKTLKTDMNEFLDSSVLKEGDKVLLKYKKDCEQLERFTDAKLEGINALLTSDSSTLWNIALFGVTVGTATATSLAIHTFIQNCDEGYVAARILEKKALYLEKCNAIKDGALMKAFVKDEFYAITPKPTPTKGQKIVAWFSNPTNIIKGTKAVVKLGNMAADGTTGAVKTGLNTIGGIADIASTFTDTNTDDNDK